MDNNNKKEILQSLQITINNCDNKASFLLNAVGIVLVFRCFPLMKLEQKMVA